MRIKVLLIFCMALFTSTTYGKKIKLTYIPQGKIIQFNYDSITIYTDTTSLFDVYKKEGALGDYALRVFSFVRRAVQNTQSDTIIFNGEFIPFDDGIESKYQQDWYIKWPILHLIDNKNIVMYDKHGQQVNAILTKRVGKKKDNFVKRSYINIDTKEELIFSTLFIRLVNPSF